MKVIRILNNFHSEIRFEDLKALENKIDKSLKDQAEDIAIDVTDLEKQVNDLSMKTAEIMARNEQLLTEKDLTRFEKYFTKKMESQ